MKYFLVGCLAVLLWSCGGSSGSEEESTNDSVSVVEEELVLPDLQVDIISEGDGEMPAIGDKVTVHYTGTLKSTGEKFDSSLDRGEPIEFRLGSGQVIKGWDMGIAQLKKGTKARLTIPAHLAYGSRSVGIIPANSDLVFDVELVDITPSPKPWNVSGIEGVETKTGLKYYIVKEGKGPKPKANQMVSVRYSGFLAENGLLFDSSEGKPEPFSFELGVGRVIPGWDEGISLLNVGSKAQLHIPYHLAYGEGGYPGAIPPKADLIFDVELVSAK